MQDILLWARSQNEDGSSTKTEFDGENVVAEVIQKFIDVIENKKVDVITQIQKNISIWADINQFRSICQNLLSNAIKFTPSGKEITVSLLETSTFYELKVSDSGAGMSEELIERILSEGDLVSSRGTDGEKGTGIGLKLVREFTSAHGGNLRFEKNSHGGTIVVVEFPKKEAEEKMNDISEEANAVQHV